MLDRPPADRRMPSDARDYLARRLDGARDLYLLALALGAREEGRAVMGRMILEARIHFAGVIEECRIAGFETEDIAHMLGDMNQELVDSVRPEIWENLERLLEHRKTGGHKRS